MRSKKIVYRDMNEATPIQAAVLGDLLLGASYTEIHLKYGIAWKTVKNWAQAFQVRKPPLPVGKNTPLPEHNTVTLLRRQDIDAGHVPYPSYDNPLPMGEQVYEYARLSLETLAAQLKVAGDPNYLKRQNAHDLAALHKVIGDRAVELVNALNAGERGESGDEED